ncbi:MULTISPECIES: Rrf2 family transcriptional regulator [Mesorhizobium]|uniref:Rrf2 family transcriptional regulator n=2 Tax=Mesorhizobium abyssinicae TaxID=1209958 RepID=A0ABU5AH95_9HYPH|nr:MULTISPECIES: Rrf2 family transcriptional regulator [Mesorhizobium]RVC60583.1 Rrf2 family transcriptional regulator [Mesorhizobium sp. M4B.F.Ca.ET.088.02.2.1]MDX8536644.1 Rrf2 family transcriptional regulator [Mesorhizobium abyssinicae]RUW26898.1 Rrf2 family transcriptional regulator [Mesorhizobium sp. M4B.F.Ca.ET.013.02.1.1]RVD16113.1 Rrf2 family transcriptional regulator [Mesorhizobium sp. M4B.F.Ca.ET.017.02.2.1]RVD34272.1 Rrf2 family transcriptional regulator [Mesorhizobium sp. M4B.F.Ca.
MNTRFAVAVHILTFLESQAGAPATSELIASSVNTNPTLIRRLLSQLAKAGLTTSQMGSGGGALLARPASSITLLDVWRAMDAAQEVFAMHEAPNPMCPVGRNIKRTLGLRIARVRSAIDAELAKTTIAAMASDVSLNAEERLTALP